MSEWSRSHDRTMAEKCEGAIKCYLVSPPDPIAKHKPELWTEWFMDLADGSCRPLPHYNTDIAACFRAAEAWRKKRAGDREYLVRSPHHHDTAYHAEAVWWGWTMHIADANTPAAALAQALYEAVKDAE